MRLTLVSILMLLSLLFAFAQNANFDSLTEDVITPYLEDGGIIFFDLDRRIEGDVVPTPFGIERADATLSGPFFSSPNTLAFGGYSPGPGAAFTRCGEFKFRLVSGGTGHFASLELFTFLSYPGNRVTLEALRNGVRVGSTTITINSIGLSHWTIAVSDVTFDTLRLYGSGTQDRGVFFGLVDNVVISPDEETEQDGDVNDDGCVDDIDLLAVLFAFGNIGDDLPEDLDGNGIVDDSDLLEVLFHFGDGC